MQKIELNENAKRLLKELKEGIHYTEIPSKYELDAKLLRKENLICTIDDEAGTMLVPRLTEFGEIYLHWNPELENPSIWDDKKYIITTAIAFWALLVSIISLFKEQIMFLWNKLNI